MEISKLRAADGVSYGLAEVGYDIRLKQDILFQPGSMIVVYGHMVKTMGQIQILCPDKEAEIYEGNFVLASAIEEFRMPDDLVGIVHDKSTWARCGLSVANTVIEPGWRGYLTLELTYNGTKPLHLPAGTGIAQVVFHQLWEKAIYQGSYQDQDNRPVGSAVQQT
jgi:dCTP deaminase